MNDLMNDYPKAYAFIQTKVVSLGMAIVFLVVGWVAIGMITSVVRRTLEKRKVDATLVPFLSSILSVLLKTALFISIASTLGIQTSSFVAVLGAAGLAVGLALQGSLSNFAGGVLMIIFRPFKKDDFVEVCGFSGTVSQIQIFNTVLLTTDNKTVILPNGAVANGPIVNFSEQDTRRVDLVFGISYGDDFEKAKSLLMGLINKDQRVLKDPEAFVRVSSLSASSVDITVRAWVAKEDYWGVYFDLLEKGKILFDEEGISFPFPQQDVHLYQQETIQ
jgi:small conductance mechanosensitive channel